jgi:hypothetical protein
MPRTPPHCRRRGLYKRATATVQNRWASRVSHSVGKIRLAAQRFGHDFGNIVAIRSYIFIQMGGAPMVWLRRDAFGMLLLNVTFISKTNTRTVISDNYWQSLDSPKTLICPPSGKSLELELHSGEYLKVKYQTVNDATSALKNYADYFADRWPVTFPATVLELDYRNDDGTYDFKPNSFRVPRMKGIPGSRVIAVDTGVLFDYPNVTHAIRFAPTSPSQQ